MFNSNEVTNEYNLLNDFLTTSLDEEAMYSSTDFQNAFQDSHLLGSLGAPLMPSNGQFTSGITQDPNAGMPRTAMAQQMPPATKPAPPMSADKAREQYYLTAADPSGSDPPEERMQKLLEAKHRAGMLKPFNYIKGYARLSKYMDQHMQQHSRQRILKQLDKFRPMFRERMQSLTDLELVLVEMWFERSLMEYDRVFASMAIPACCWRRTGEIFRGNREMAELIHVPIESFREVRSTPTRLVSYADATQGKLAIHEIIVEDQLVSYWEKFGAIAFDGAQKAMLTSCTLRNPDLKSTDKVIPCCFSFTIKRDNHNM